MGDAWNGEPKTNQNATGNLSPCIKTECSDTREVTRSLLDDPDSIDTADCRVYMIYRAIPGAYPTERRKPDSLDLFRKVLRDVLQIGGCANNFEEASPLAPQPTVSSRQR